MPVTERILTTVLLIAMVSAGILAWSIRLRPAMKIEATSLEAIPMSYDGWHGKDIPVQDAVSEMLQADFQVQRAYAHPVAGVAWVYVGYYGSDRGGHPEHLPQVCYPAQGWKILERRTIEIDGSRGLRANEFVVEQAGQQRLVHYWFRSHRSTGLLGGWRINLDHLIGRLTQGRADGALIRISTVIEGEDLEAIRARLRGFESKTDALLGEHWPSEKLGSKKNANPSRYSYGVSGSPTSSGE